MLVSSRVADAFQPEMVAVKEALYRAVRISRVQKGKLSRSSRSLRIMPEHAIQCRFQRDFTARRS